MAAKTWPKTAKKFITEKRQKQQLKVSENIIEKSVDDVAFLVWKTFSVLLEQNCVVMVRAVSCVVQK